MDQVEFEGLNFNADYDTNLNFNFDVSVNTPNNDDGGFISLEPPAESDSSSNKQLNTEIKKAYHTKRPHKKSRAGCQQCKKRKVKCDEVRPTCKSCRLRKEKCIYPTTHASDSLSVGAKSPSPYASSSQSQSQSPSPSPSSPGCSSLSSSQEIITARNIIVSEPLFRPSQLCDNIDMKMLWFFTTQAYHEFSIQTGRSPIVDNVLQVKFVQYAFDSPFLMDCIMAVSSLHLQSINQPIPAQRAIAYRTRAFEGYRKAIEEANPQHFPALIATSLLVIAVSSQMFREPGGKPLYILDWMMVWRGIGLIVDIVSPGALQESGMAVLFYRPPVDLRKTTPHIPNNLLFMVASIQPGDTDDGHQQAYYDMLKYLGSLYQELKVHGFNSILDLRILSFLTFIPKDFLPLAQEHRPRALIILAHYLCFAKLTSDVWWMEGIADREITQICHQIGDEWAHLMRVPQMVLKIRNNVEIARLIVENRNWTPIEMEEYEREQDPRVETDPRLIDNDGIEIEIYEGQWRHKSFIRSNARELTYTELVGSLEDRSRSVASDVDLTSNP